MTEKQIKSGVIYSPTYMSGRPAFEGDSVILKPDPKTGLSGIGKIFEIHSPRESRIRDGWGAVVEIWFQESTPGVARLAWVAKNHLIHASDAWVVNEIRQAQIDKTMRKLEAKVLKKEANA